MTLLDSQELLYAKNVINQRYR